MRSPRSQLVTFQLPLKQNLGAEAIGLYAKLIKIYSSICRAEDAFALDRIRLSLISGAEGRLKFLTRFDKGIAASPLEGTFEFVGDTSWYEWDGGVGAELNTILAVVVVVVAFVVVVAAVVVVVEWEDGEDIGWALVFGTFLFRNIFASNVFQMSSGRGHCPYTCQPCIQFIFCVVLQMSRSVKHDIFRL